MALSTIIQTSRHGSLTLLDGTATPITYSVRFDRGDFSVSGLSPDMAEIVTFAARHVHIGHAKGAPTYPSISFSLFVTDYSETGTGTIQDFLHATSSTPFENRVSVSTKYDGFAFDVRWDADPDDDDAAESTLTFHGVVCTGYDIAESDDGTTITVNGTVYGSSTTNNYVSGDIVIPMAT